MKLTINQYLVETTAGPGNKTNFPTKYLADLKPRDRRPIYYWAVDLDDNTVIKARDAKSAIAEAERLQKLYPDSKIDVREVNLNEQDFRREDAQRLKRKWEEQIYRR